MYKIYHKLTKRYLAGHMGEIFWTNRDHARIFRLEEDIVNFLRMYRSYEGHVPPMWRVIQYRPVKLASKTASVVVDEGMQAWK